MKTISKGLRIIILTALSLAGLALFAQDKPQKDEQQKFRLYMIKDENGNKEVIDKTFGTKEEMDAYIKDNKIDMPDADAVVNASGSGKTVIIKNDKEGDEDIEISDMPAPPAPPVPPAAPGAPCPSQKACEKKCTRKVIIIEKDESNNSGKMDLQINAQQLSADERMKVVQQLLDMKIGEVQFVEAPEAGNANTQKNRPGATGIEQSAPETSNNLSEIKVYPNPSNGQFHIEFKVGKPTDVKLRITDSDGKQVYADALNNYSGKFEREIDNLSLAKGTYLLSIDAGGVQKTTSLMMQ